MLKYFELFFISGAECVWIRKRPLNYSDQASTYATTSACWNPYPFQGIFNFRRMAHLKLKYAKKVVISNKLFIIRTLNTDVLNTYVLVLFYESKILMIPSMETWNYTEKCYNIFSIQQNNGNQDNQLHYFPKTELNSW